MGFHAAHQDVPKKKNIEYHECLKETSLSFSFHETKSPELCNATVDGSDIPNNHMGWC